MATIIPLQERLRPIIPPVFGCKDYRDELLLLDRIDSVLRSSGIEKKFLELSLERWTTAKTTALKPGEEVSMSAAAEERFVRQSGWALRCTVLKHLLGLSYRELSRTLAIGPLYREFCGLEDFERVRVPGKSTLREYVHWLPAEQLAEVLDQLTRAVGSVEQARLIGLENELDLTVVSVDTTCLPANVHFPTDWVLLRDGVRTIIKSVLTIRRHGLKRRIPEPAGFLSEVNALAMAMNAASRRKRTGKKERKAVFRKLKRICKAVEEHGRRYHELLDTHWAETDLSRKEAEVILRRLDNVLEQLPEARRQAHERIVGERLVKNEEKILSLYQKDIHVIVRGKAGADVEFGNSLFLAETVNGLIIDHELKRGMSKGDSQWLRDRFGALARKAGGTLHGVIGDRGFDSKKARKLLEKNEVFCALCPRDPKELSRRMAKDETFIVSMRGRGKTEGRIGILKNVFLDEVPRAKSYATRQAQVAWAILAHNLWVVARIPPAKAAKAPAKAA